MDTITMMPANETTLSISALRTGDADTWRVLFETYGEPLYLFAFHRCGGDPSAAEDVRQETFLTAIECIDRYRGDGPLGGSLFGWLCGIARHKSADWLRRHGRESAFSDQSPGADADQDDETSMLAQLPDLSQPLPEEWAERSQTRAAVVAALWSLPVEYRQALVLRYGRGAPVDEVAARLKRSYKAVESLLSRARLALRERLKEELDGPAK